MKTHETRRILIRGWLAPPTDKRGIEEQVQRIANALFFGLAIFSVAFAYFVLSARAQDYPPARATPGAFHSTCCPPKHRGGGAIFAIESVAALIPRGTDGKS